MSRIAPVTPGTDPAAAAVEARLLAARGAITPLYRILLNSPVAAEGWEAMMTIVRQRLTLSPRLRELVILRIAVLNDAPYEFQAHLPHAAAAGLAEGEIAALRDEAPARFGPIERSVIAYCDAMTRDIRVDDATYAAVAAHFDATALIDLTVTIAAYNMVSRLLTALDIH